MWYLAEILQVFNCVCGLVVLCVLLRLFPIRFTAFPVTFEWFMVWKFPFISTIDILHQPGVKLRTFSEHFLSILEKEGKFQA